jgi:hypothetical protein
MWRWIFIACLLLSLGANAYLWLNRPTAEAHPRDRWQPKRAARALRRAQVEALPDAGAQPQPYKDLDRAELEQRVVTTETRIADLLPTREKYARDARSPEAEALAKRYLDIVFKTQPGAPARYHVECHGRACKLETSVPRDEWNDQLQSTWPEHGWFRVISFTPNDTYLELWKPELFGFGLWHGISAAFRASDQTKACITDRTIAGEVSFRVRFESGSLSSTASGSLLSHPIGQCLRRVFDGIVANTGLPPGLTSFPEEPIEMQLPTDDAE